MELASHPDVIRTEEPAGQINLDHDRRIQRSDALIPVSLWLACSSLIFGGLGLPLRQHSVADPHRQWNEPEWKEHDWKVKCNNPDAENEEEA